MNKYSKYSVLWVFTGLILFLVFFSINYFQIGIMMFSICIIISISNLYIFFRENNRKDNNLKKKEKQE
jgi:hypothetical protein